MKFTNDLDLDEEGNIYFTDSSYVRNINRAVELFNEASPTGRLFRFNEITKELVLLVDNIRFANGVQLTPEKDAVLVSELALAQIIKYNLKGPKQGHKEVFLTLPGFADNIRISPFKTLFVAFANVRQPNRWPHSLLDFLGEYPTIRTLIGMIFNLRTIMLHYVPKYGLLAEYDFNGTLIKSWHDSTAQNIEVITCVTYYQKKLYLGSFYHDYLAAVDY
jgi:adipocyte plasma membrane-associated protein